MSREIELYQYKREEVDYYAGYRESVFWVVGSKFITGQAALEKRNTNVVAWTPIAKFRIKFHYEVDKMAWGFFYKRLVANGQL